MENAFDRWTAGCLVRAGPLAVWSALDRWPFGPRWIAGRLVRAGPLVVWSALDRWPFGSCWTVGRLVRAGPLAVDGRLTDTVSSYSGRIRLKRRLVPGVTAYSWVRAGVLFHSLSFLVSVSRRKRARSMEGASQTHFLRSAEV